MAEPSEYKQSTVVAAGGGASLNIQLTKKKNMQRGCEMTHNLAKLCCLNSELNSVLHRKIKLQ